MCARGNNKIIIGYFARICFNCFLFIFNPGYIGITLNKIFLRFKQLAQGKTNCIRFQTGYCNLIKKWLKLMEIIFIDKNDLYWFVFHVFYEIHAGKA